MADTKKKGRGEVVRMPSVAERIQAENPHYPRPTVWKVLVRPVAIADMTAGGIALPEEARRAKGHLRYFGQVVGMGPLCFQGPKFLDDDGNRHPACKVGDWIAFGAYAGQTMRMKARGAEKPEELRLLNDDEVMAVVPEPDALHIYCD